MAKITLVLGGARSGKSVFAERLAKKYNDVVYIATAETRDDEMRERVRLHRERRPRNWKTIESPLHVDKVVSDLNGTAGLVLIDCITLYVTNLLLRGDPAVESGQRPVAPLPVKGLDAPHSSSPSRMSTMDDRAFSPLLTGTGAGAEEKIFSNQKAHPDGCTGMQTGNPQERQQVILSEIHKLGQVCRESGYDVILISNEVGLSIVPDNALSREFRDIAGYANQILAGEANEVYFMVAGIAQRIK